MPFFFLFHIDKMLLRHKHIHVYEEPLEPKQKTHPHYSDNNKKNYNKL